MLKENSAVFCTFTEFKALLKLERDAKEKSCDYLREMFIITKFCSRGRVKNKKNNKLKFGKLRGYHYLVIRGNC